MQTTDLLAITSYYNPFRGGLRTQNYRTFRKYLGIKLLTVEWSVEGSFDLCAQDADILIQISGGDILWQKERLLNIGLKKAKELGFSRVAFLDCDIVFKDRNWFQSVNAALDECSIVQCYSHVHYMPPMRHIDMRHQDLVAMRPEFTLASLAHGMKKNNGSMRLTNNSNHTSPIGELCGNSGMAIAIRSDKYPLWEYYEANIVGGGDSVFIATAINRLEELFSLRNYSPAHKSHLQAWQEKYAPINPKFGYVNNEISHLWHGEIVKRGYVDRFSILRENNFDPKIDLTKDRSGALKFANNKNKLKEDVFKYLSSRQDS